MISAHRPVRLGFAGCGNVLGAYLALAERLHWRGAAEVTAFYGRAHQRARGLAAWPGADFEADYERFLARADVDAVVILTPMPEHAPMAQAALRAGKHVLVEKPLATNLHDAKVLLELAAQSPGRLFCAPFTTLSPTFQVIGQRLRRGEIGRVASARGRYGWAGPDWSDWFYQPGGGALFDLGVYILTTLTGWLGPVRRVTAFSGIAVEERMVGGRSVRVQADDNTQLLLEFRQGCLASLTSGFVIQQYRGPGLELFGLEGTINLLGDDWDPDGYELWQNSAGCWQCFRETNPDWPWTDGLRHLVECVREGKRPAVQPEHAYHVLEVMVQALAAARDGQSRLLESTFELSAVGEETETIAAHRVHDRTRQE